LFIKPGLWNWHTIYFTNMSVVVKSVTKYSDKIIDINLPYTIHVVFIRLLNGIFQTDFINIFVCKKEYNNKRKLKSH
jgi:hypothetical protein